MMGKSREGREYKIGRDRRERINDWEEDKGEKTRLGRREGREYKIWKERRGEKRRLGGS